MSRLHLNESGRVISTLGEELTVDRRARKVLELPATKQPGVMYVLARPHRDFEGPLRIAVNGREVEPIRPGPAPGFLWYEIEIEAQLLCPGPNVIELWSDAIVDDRLGTGDGRRHGHDRELAQ